MKLFNIFSWWHNHHDLFLHCNRKVSTIQLSRPLWDLIQNDQMIAEHLRANVPLKEDECNEDENDEPKVVDASAVSGFAVLFTKICNPMILQAEGHRLFHPRYAMFINPIWHLHGVNDPKRIQTVPLSVSEQGHIGFQSIQPSVEEIASVYGIDQNNEIFDIKIKRFTINGEPYYELQRH